MFLQFMSTAALGFSIDYRVAKYDDVNNQQTSKGLLYSKGRYMTADAVAFMAQGFSYDHDPFCSLHMQQYHDMQYFALC
jgi:hypothetical protein